MNLLISALMILLAANAGAVCLTCGPARAYMDNGLIDRNMPILGPDDTAASRWLNIVRVSTASSIFFIGVDSSTWHVVKGSEAVTLEQFILRGGVCEWRGYHQWHIHSIRREHDGLHEVAIMNCRLCNKYREKRMTREYGDLEWEE